MGAGHQRKYRACDNARQTGNFNGREEKEQIIDGTTGDSGGMWRTERFRSRKKYEDIHSFVEANLIDRIGDAGKKLHTGRSRNDQVALDMKLYTRDEILELDALLKEMS